MFSDTDKDWEYYGKKSPYYGVLTHDDYRLENLNEDTIDHFFKSGDEYINHVANTIHHHISKEFSPKRVLDFGCGVGRLLVPLAKRYEYVVGVDVSQSMLNEAQRNCHKFNIFNINLALSDSSLSQLSGTFDFINSYIVFQHIPENKGNALLRLLLDILKPGGVGALHFTYKCSFNQRILNTFPIAYIFYSLYKGNPIGDRPMRMSEYNINLLFSYLQENNCCDIYASFTEHGKNYGITLFFKKNFV